MKQLIAEQTAPGSENKDDIGDHHHKRVRKQLLTKSLLGLLVSVIVGQWGDGTAKKNYLARPSKKLCLKCMLLGTSGVIWDDLGTSWSGISGFRMQNHSVL